jgi:uncharacterized protein YkwD
MNGISIFRRCLRLLVAFFVGLSLSDATVALDITALNKSELAKHNQYRSLSGVPLVTYSANLAVNAQKHAELMLKTNKFQHSGTANMGENLYSCTGSHDSACLLPGAATEAWYSEIKEYNFTEPGFNLQTGHYTQVVWKGTTMIGCGYATGHKSEDNSFISYVVCNYSPPGNYLDFFGSNVIKPTKF